MRRHNNVFEDDFALDDGYMSDDNQRTSKRDDDAPPKPDSHAPVAFPHDAPPAPPPVRNAPSAKVGAAAVGLDSLSMSDDDGDDVSDSAYLEEPGRPRAGRALTSSTGEDYVEGPETLRVVDGFLDPALAAELRGTFDARFEDPRELHENRFVWDYWRVPQQYDLHRTFAADYFGDTDAYDRLEDALLAFGQRELGCAAMTPVWLSYYVDGNGQELHCDNPHGPWAFVLSLTEWDDDVARRAFEGGETMLLKQAVLDFWRGFPGGAMEFGDIVDLVEPRFNRLTVFDPRIPHGVRQVRGTRDPRRGRLVLHGWFTDPEPFFDDDAGVDGAEASDALNAALGPLFAELGQMPRAYGTLTVRLTIDGGTGEVDGLEWLTDTLMPDRGECLDVEDVRAQVLDVVEARLMTAQMPAREDGSDESWCITLPLVFD
ncbi:unnamed protein product [Pedinophyceae sp. YPF-701]|nr:unnamed protein product [Pedinophyceae sp. YPF-701]